MRYTKDIKKIQPIVVNKVKHYTEKWRTVVVTLCQTIIPVPKCLAKCYVKTYRRQPHDESLTFCQLKYDGKVTQM